MKKSLKLIVQLFAMVLPASMYAKYFDKLMVYNGETYNYGYVCDFQVDGISYLISELDSSIVYVSADTCLLDVTKSPEPKVVINSSYHGVVTIPEKVTYNGVDYDVRGIDMGAFQGCCDLDSVIIHDSLDEIRNYAFSGCTNLNGIYLPQGMKWIGGYAFSGCTKLKSAELPKNLIIIDDGVFHGCTNLQYVTIPKGITLLTGDIFDGCSQLKKIIIYSSTPIRIQYNGGVGTGGHFKGVSRTECTIFVPENSVADYKTADVWETFQNIEPIPGFYTVGDISYAINSPTEKTVRIIDAKCSGDYKIPSSVIIGGERYTITGIDDYAFYWNTSLKSVSLPESLTYIGKYAFAGCIDLDSLTIPDNIEYLDNYSFWNCRALKKIVIKGNTQLYECAFDWCYYIDSIIIESPIPPIMRNNDYLWYTTDGPFVQETYWNATICIPEGSFYLYAASDTWSRFRSFYSYLDEGYKSDFEDDTIYYTFQSDGVYVGARAVSRNMFSKKEGLDGPLTPRDPKNGGMQPRAPIRNWPPKATDNTQDFTPYRGNVVIPETASVSDRTYPVTGINYLAFVGSQDLKSIIIPESVKHIEYATFAGCSGLEDVILPSGITEIPEAMFYYCSSIGRMIIPDKVQSIGNSAFACCTSLTEITIPAGVKHIGQYAFAYCSGLKRIVIEGNPVIDETAFIGCSAGLEFVYTTKVESHKALDSEGTIHYGIDGRIIKPGTPGLHLIKHKDGTVSKSLVR